MNLHILKVLAMIFALTAFATATAQQSNSTYYIDVLIDADKNIYFDDATISLDAVPKRTRSEVNKLKFEEGKSITYRIFADSKLKLGDIIDVQEKMYEGFSQPYLVTRRYLLTTKEIPLDKSNWIDKLNKLNLKAVEN